MHLEHTRESQMHPIVDTHAHLFYDEEQYSYREDIGEVIARAEAVGVAAALIPNIDQGSYSQMMHLVEAYPHFCYPMIGLHPTEVRADYKAQLAFLKSELEQAPSHFVGIGEIGLDYHWDLTYKAEMQEAFRQQIEWALTYNLPTSMHSRDAESDLIAITKEYPTLRGVVHAFGGKKEELAKALEHPGLMVGIGGVLTFKNSGLKETIRDLLPLERILVETDAPYLAPTPYRGKRNEPAFLIHVLEHLAELYSVSMEDLRAQLFANTRKMFNLAL